MGLKKQLVRDTVAVDKHAHLPIAQINQSSAAHLESPFPFSSICGWNPSPHPHPATSLQRDLSFSPIDQVCSLLIGPNCFSVIAAGFRW